MILFDADLRISETSASEHCLEAIGPHKNSKSRPLIEDVVKAPSACMDTGSGHPPALDDMACHPSIATLRGQEPTLRALLDKVNVFGPRGQAARHRPVTMPPSNDEPGAAAESSSRLHDPELSGLSKQLLKLCSLNQRPRENGHA